MSFYRSSTYIISNILIIYEKYIFIFVKLFDYLVLKENPNLCCTFTLGQNGITQPVPTVHTIHKVLDINSRQHLWRHEFLKLSDMYGIQYDA